jgi:hypothetical protein
MIVVVERVRLFTQRALRHNCCFEHGSSSALTSLSVVGLSRSIQNLWQMDLFYYLFDELEGGKIARISGFVNAIGHDLRVIVRR